MHETTANRPSSDFVRLYLVAKEFNQIKMFFYLKIINGDNTGDHITSEQSLKSVTPHSPYSCNHESTGQSSGISSG